MFGSTTLIPLSSCSSYGFTPDITFSFSQTDGTRETGHGLNPYMGVITEEVRGGGETKVTGRGRLREMEKISKK